jgi:hypothetical protein
MRTKFWSENMNGRYGLEHQGVDEMIILKWIFKWMLKEQYENMILLMIGSSGGLLWTR